MNEPDWSTVATEAPPAAAGGHTSWEEVASDSPTAPTQKSSPVSDEVGNILQKLHVAGGLEAAAHTATGAALSIPAGLASTWQLIKPRGPSKPGVLGDPSTGTRDRVGAAAKASADVQNQQYQPRTDEGKDLSALTDRALGALGPTEGQWLEDAALKYGAHPAVAGGLNVAANIPAVLLGARSGAGRSVGRTVSPEVARATGNRYRLTPQQAGAGMPSRVIAALSNRPQLERGLSHSNAVVTDNFAKADVGLQPGDALNDATLDRQAAPHNQAYREVAGLGRVVPDQAYYQAIQNVPNRSGGGAFAADVPPTIRRRLNIYGNVREFDAGDAVARMKALRADANRIDRSPSYSPDMGAVSTANRAIADALEDALDRHVQQLTRPVTLPDGQVITPSIVDPGLLDRFREARPQLAKINNIRDALEGPNVNAKTILRMRKNGAPLTGGLAEIAHMAENFDNSVQVPAHIRDHEAGFGDLFLGLGGAGGHSAYYGGAAYEPHALLAGAALGLSRPVTRALMRTRLFQRYLAHPPRIPGSAIGAAAAAGAEQSSEGAVKGVFGQPVDTGSPMELR